MCLARLHNYCITERLNSKKPLTLAPPLASDAVEIAANGGIPLNNESPEQLLHGGEHFDDVTINMRRSVQYRARKETSGKLPQEIMLESVVRQQLKRPEPLQWAEKR